MAVFLLIVSLILAIVIVNFLQQVFMKILNIDAMYYSIKTKLIIIGVVFLLLFGLMLKGCGVQV